MRALVIFLFALGTWVTSAFDLALAQGPDRAELGSTELSAARGEHRFEFDDTPVQARDIRLRIISGRIRITEIRVAFADGSDHIDRDPVNLTPTDWTPPFAIDLNYRTLSRVSVFYERVGSEVPTLKLYGATVPISPSSAADIAALDRRVREIREKQPTAGSNENRLSAELSVLIAERDATFSSGLAAAAQQREEESRRKQDALRESREALSAARSALRLAEGAARRASRRSVITRRRATRGIIRFGVNSQAAALLRRRSTEARRRAAATTTQVRRARQRVSVARSRVARNRRQVGVADRRTEVAKRLAAQAQQIATASARFASDPRMASAATIDSPEHTRACIVEGECTAVQIFFGTNRKKSDDPERVSFTSQRQAANILGRAVVTVPRAAPRTSGEIVRPSWWDLNVMRVPEAGDPKRHFVIVENGFRFYADEDAFVGAVKAHAAGAGTYKDHAVVYVHGYRTSFDNALYRAAQIAYDLGLPIVTSDRHEPFGTAFMYSWPSAGQFKDYPHDIENAFRSVDQLETFLQLVINKTGAKHVHIIAHSMGNLPVLNALEEMAMDDKNASAISQVIFASPDVNTSDFKRLAENIRSIVGNMTLYASENDLAMRASRLVHGDKPRAGDVVNGRPTIARGVDTIDVSAMSTSYWSLGHNEYVDQTVLLNDIAQLLRARYRAPHERNLTWRPTGLPPEVFWRYRE